MKESKKPPKRRTTPPKANKNVTSNNVPGGGIFLNLASSACCYTPPPPTLDCLSTQIYKLADRVYVLECKETLGQKVKKFINKINPLNYRIAHKSKVSKW